MNITIDNDTAGMRAALEWSARGRGLTSPRPSVGCVLVKNGRILGGGHTQPGDGNPHAEVEALRKAKGAGHDTHGVTAYVTLEPCSHIGTTAPCTDALIAAGVARVVIGVRDPNPLIDGRGVAQLRAAGIEVVEGFLELECAQAQDHFLKYIATAVPFVTLKCAVSLDGKIAAANGNSQWITGPGARRQAHRLRADHDAVLVGSNTVRVDDPRLTVRLDNEADRPAPRPPARIVLNAGADLGDLPQAPRFLEPQGGGGGRALVIVGEDAPQSRRERLQAMGARVVAVPQEGERLQLLAMLEVLPQHGIYSVLIEGGAAVAASALSAKLVDKVVYFIAPLLLGGDAVDAVGPLGIEQLGEALRLRDITSERFEDDFMIAGYTRALPGTRDYVHRAY